ncbi:tubulin polyglutamylase TTLL6 [Drosophila novamexicana]|uniref:tubulin polyglutamylase TTLL6 n=1 Tax=Drosophila novamexicana TaxID=47314 RepID=UPI0011E5CDEA|nr:tubulin polyglutamylase TTLL6 [Drosophila novamexicana]
MEPPSISETQSESRNEYKLSEKRTKSSALTLGTIPLRAVMLFLAATVFTAVLLEILPHYTKTKTEIEPLNGTENALVRQRAYSIYTTSPTEEHLVHVLDVLNIFGYKRVELEDNWDLLWAHDYPFRVMPKLKNLEKHQFVNHLPGCGYLTNKVDLCTTRLPFLPRAFRLPDQRNALLEYASAHPEALFVQKHNEHRHIKVRALNDIDFHSNDSFVQEFIQKPFLVDGHKFDIGVYVVITSINPLRVYIYNGDVLFRYCPVKYYPFDFEIQDKYVVADNYLPTWEVPSLRKYYNNYGGSMRASFEAYVRDQNMDPSKIWPQVEHIIRTTILTKEQDLIDTLRMYKRHNFFDLLRFDLFIDEELNVHLMEANMSPNLSSAHFKENSLLYKQVLYSVFNLVGIRPVIKSEISHSPLSEVITADKNLATALNNCTSNDCDKSCNKEECSLCLPCISGTEYKWLQEAHDEHLHRVDMKRIFPKPIHNIDTFDIDIETTQMSKRNAWITRWFFNKCQYDRTWCT